MSLSAQARQALYPQLSAAIDRITRETSTAASTNYDRERSIKLYCDWAAGSRLFGPNWDPPDRAALLQYRAHLDDRFGQGSLTAYSEYARFVRTLRHVGLRFASMLSYGPHQYRRAAPRLSDAQEDVLRLELARLIRELGALFFAVEQERQRLLEEGPPSTSNLDDMTFREVARYAVNCCGGSLPIRDRNGNKDSVAERIRTRYSDQWELMRLLAGPRLSHWIPFHNHFMLETSANSSTLYQLHVGGVEHGWLHAPKDRKGGEAWHRLRSRPHLSVEEAYEIGLRLRAPLAAQADLSIRSDYFLYRFNDETLSMARFNRKVRRGLSKAQRHFFDDLARRIGVPFTDVDAQHLRRTALCRIAFREEQALAAVQERTGHSSGRELMSYFDKEEQRALVIRERRAWMTFWDNLVEQASIHFSPAPSRAAVAVIRDLTRQRCPAQPGLAPKKAPVANRHACRSNFSAPVSTLSRSSARSFHVSDDYPVSAQSKFADMTWYFREETKHLIPEQHRWVLEFESMLADGTRMSAAENVLFLSDWKRMANAQREGRTNFGKTAPSTLIYQRTAWIWLIGRLKLEGARSFAAFYGEIANRVIRAAAMLEPWLKTVVFIILRFLAVYPQFLACPPAVRLRDPRLTVIPRQKHPPTRGLTAIDALLLSGWLWAMVKHGEQALAACADQFSLPRFTEALRSFDERYQPGDVFTACEAVILLETWMRGLELVTTPVRQSNDRSPHRILTADQITPVIAEFWQKGKHNKYKPGGVVPASENAQRAVQILDVVAQASGLDRIAIGTRDHSVITLTTRKLYRRLNRLPKRWSFRDSSGHVFRLNARLFRATASSLPVYFASPSSAFLCDQLRNSQSTMESSYARLAADDIAKEQASMPLRCRFPRPDVSHAH